MINGANGHIQLFSALYSMLPSANRYLKKSGLSPRPAALLLTGCFLGGVVGIRIVSHLLHAYIPTEVIDCHHTHGVGDGSQEPQTEEHHPRQRSQEPPSDVSKIRHAGTGRPAMEETPLLSSVINDDSSFIDARKSINSTHRPTSALNKMQTNRRPALQARLRSQVSSFVYGDQSSCDEGGPCYGFSNPCGRDGLKFLPPKRSEDDSNALARNSLQPNLRRSPTAPSSQRKRTSLCLVDVESGRAAGSRGTEPADDEETHDDESASYSGVANGNAHQRRVANGGPAEDGKGGHEGVDSKEHSKQSHHHHVPTNAFLSIGLQTSIAIALHKLPEGFITYATNHANPQLGFAVFMALFIHNITEGFAMALPLFLAIGSRWKAMFWSSLLGGVSQPLGAGVAALWFGLAGKGSMAPGEGVYGVMFAITGKPICNFSLSLSLSLCMCVDNIQLSPAVGFVDLCT